MNDFFILIIGFIVFIIVINTIVYFYIKYKCKLFFSYIEKRKFTLIKKVDTDIEKNSRISYKFMHRKSDIVFLDQEIFILTWNKPIIQITNSFEKFPGVFENFNYHSKVKINDHLEIKGNFNQGFIKWTYKISLNFKGKNFDLEKYLNQSV